MPGDNRRTGARRRARPASLAQHIVNDGDLLLFVKADCRERAQRIADPAAGAFFRIHDAGGGFDLDLAPGDQGLDGGGRRPGLRHRIRNILGTLAGAGDEDSVGCSRYRSKLRMPFREEGTRRRS